MIIRSGASPSHLASRTQAQSARKSNLDKLFGADVLRGNPHR
jgi:hypothetical protein